MSATPEQFGKHLAQNSAQTRKTAGVFDEVARRASHFGKSVVNQDMGHMLEAMTPKAQGFKRYLELLTFARARQMDKNVTPLLENAVKLHKPFYGGAIPAELRNQWISQVERAVEPEVLKSLGTAGGTGVGASLGISAGANALFGGDKKANSNPADAHGSSFVPLMGGAISGAVKPHPSRGTLTNVLGEGLAGLKGGTIGSLIGGGAGAVTDLATKFKGRGVPTLLGTLLGGSLGTHVGSQLHRESIPLNARALAELTNKKSAAEKTAILDGALIGGALGGASAPEGNVLRGVGRGMVRGIGTELGAVGGGLVGGAAGGTAGAAGGAGLGALAALLSKNNRSELGRLALAGAYMGGQLGGVGGGLAGLYHGGRAGYNAAGKLMGPASYAKQSADKHAGIGQSVGKAVDAAGAHIGDTARAFGRGVSQYFNDVTGNTLRKHLAHLKDIRASRHAERDALAAAKQNFQNVLVNAQRYAPKSVKALNTHVLPGTGLNAGVKVPGHLSELPAVEKAFDSLDAAVSNNRFGRADYRIESRGLTPELRERVNNARAATGGVAGLAGILGVGGGIGRAVANAQNAAAEEKSASLPEGLFASIPGAVSGGTAGLGVGALYGLLSGALQARKGKKLRGAAMGALRGAGGGGLIGAGIGGGLGLGTGLMMPNVFTTNPAQQARTAVSIASDPIRHAAKMTAGALVGGVGGGYLGNKARKKLIGDKPESEDEEEEGLETEDKTEMDPALKTASFLSDAAKPCARSAT